MKKFYSLLALLFFALGSAMADSELPTLSTDEATVYYAIKSNDASKYATWTGDNSTITQESSISSIANIWYFTGTTSDDGTYETVKIHNLSTNNLLATISSTTPTFNSDGADWYIKSYTSGETTGFFIATNTSGKGAWNNWGGGWWATQIGSWDADGTGAIFSFEEVDAATVKELVATQASSYASLSTDIVGAPTDASVLTTLSEAYTAYSSNATDDNFTTLHSALLSYINADKSTFEYGVAYQIYNDYDDRGYLVYNSSYADNPKLASTTKYSSYISSLITDEGVYSNWALYTSGGKTYLYNIDAEKFIGYNSKATLDYAASPVTLTASATQAAAWTLYLDGNSSAVSLSPGYYLDGPCVNFWSNGSDGGNPLRFKKVSDVTIDEELLSIVQAEVILANMTASDYVGGYNETALTNAKTTFHTAENRTGTNAAAIIAGTYVTANAIDADTYYQIKSAATELGATKIDNPFWSSEANTTGTTGGYSGEQNLQRSSSSGATVPQLWKFQTSTEEGQYYIVNANTASALGKPWNSNNEIINVQLLASTTGTTYAGSYTIAHTATDSKTLSTTNTQWEIYAINSDNSDKIHRLNALGGNDDNATGLGDWDQNSDNDNGNYWYIIPVTTIPLTIASTTNWASACYPFGVTLPSTLEAYYVSAADGSTGEATLTSIGQSVPDNTPVFITLASSDATLESSYTLTINDELSGSYDNKLEGATVARTGFAAYDATASTGIYVLTHNDEGAVLRPNKSYTSDETTTYISTIPANKAYLPIANVSNPQATQGLRFNFGEATGINAINTNNVTEGNDTYYDLNGRRVLYPVHGIFVKGNGQKVYIK